MIYRNQATSFRRGSWLGTNAEMIVQAEFFGPVGIVGKVKAWTGSAWVSVKSWDGAAWRYIKAWTGSVWV